MNKALRGLKTLIWVKQRRIDQLEQTAKEQLQAVAECEARVQEALEAESACRAGEAECNAKIVARLQTTLSFRPIEIVTLRYVLEGLVEHTRKAAKATKDTEKAKAAAQQALAVTRQAQQRASQQREQLDEKLRKLRRELDAAAEDAQDEESEEAAIARMLAGRSLAAELERLEDCSRE